MKKLGLLGEKLGHSYSKEIHEIFFKLTGKDASYKLIEKEMEDIPSFMQELREGKFDGVNVTIPYKNEVMNYMDNISDSAKKIGAVNTITVKNGKLIGDNTDYFGFLKTLQQNDINVKDGKILMLGTGGAAKAVYNVLIDEGAKNIYLATISENDSFEIRKGDRLIHYSEIRNVRNVNLIVNCTPVGMYPAVNMTPLEEVNMINTDCVVDIIYNPEETVLMKKYKERNVKAVNGLTMLIFQAIKSEEIWNDEKYDDEVLKKVHEKLGLTREQFINAKNELGGHGEIKKFFD